MVSTLYHSRVLCYCLLPPSFLFLIVYHKAKCKEYLQKFLYLYPDLPRMLMPSESHCGQIFTVTGVFNYPNK